jgi:DNA-binding transcriptional ArsR family regulator
MTTAIQKREQYAAEIDVALNKALAHPLRHRILAIMRERPSSPTEIANQLDVPREKIAYHVRRLAGRRKGGKDTIPLIELVTTSNRHGGVEHFYRTIARPVIDTAESRGIARQDLATISADTADLISGDLSNSIAAGALDSHPARCLLRDPGLTVDDEGFEKVAEILMKALDDVTEVGAESLGRLSGRPGIPIVASLLAFQRG